MKRCHENEKKTGEKNAVLSDHLYLICIRLESKVQDTLVGEQELGGG